MIRIFTPPDPKSDFGTKTGVPSLSPNKPKIQQSLIELKFSGSARPYKESKLVMKEFTPPKPKPNFWAEGSGAKPPKSAKNSTKSNLPQIFRVGHFKWMSNVSDKKIYPPPKPNPDFEAKKGEPPPPNQPKSSLAPIFKVGQAK